MPLNYSQLPNNQYKIIVGVVAGIVVAFIVAMIIVAVAR
jgi:high-affinity Fe2+/Pb2+ permease